MEANLNKIIMSKISRTIENLQKNNINAVYVPTAKEAYALTESLLIKGETVGVGGSVTLDQVGILELLRNGNYSFFDRYDAKLTQEEREVVQHKALTCDTFLSSSNAITETGYLYNVDGRGSRTAAFVYGPKRVIVLAGYNKIVPTLEDAVKRVKNIACPANCVRLDRDTYCSKNGHCVGEGIEIPAGSCSHSICNTTVISGFQGNKNKFTVIIIGEELGY